MHIPVEDYIWSTGEVVRCGYSCTWAKRKPDSGGDTPFLSVLHAAARPHTPFLSGVAVSISDTDLSVRMSFADKVNALRHFFSIPDAQDLMSAVAAMNAAMGIIAISVLPVQVDMLIAATGVHAM